MKYLDAETVVAMRDAVPEAILIGRDEDPFPERNPARMAIARQMDVVTTTSSGRFLRTYKDAGVPRCAFIPNMCDPDIQHRYAVDERWKVDIIFTGKAEHTRLDRNDERHKLVKRLSQMSNARLYGCFGIPRVEGIETFYAISGAKVALSINITNDVRLYHSDRLVNYLACGTFTLAKRVPDSDLLFEDGVYLKYFDTADEFFELAEWYLKNEQEREKMARAGMERAHSEFNCEKIAKHILDLIETGTYDAPWACVL
jgi:spore maturation protein CgeB